MFVSKEARIGVDYFLPYPDAFNELKPPPVSRKTAEIILRLRDEGIISPRVVGAIADIEEDLERLVKQ